MREIRPRPSLLDHASGHAIRLQRIYEESDRVLVNVIAFLVLCRFGLEQFEQKHQSLLALVRMPLEGAEWLTVVILFCSLIKHLAKWSRDETIPDEGDEAKNGLSSD